MHVGGPQCEKLKGKNYAHPTTVGIDASEAFYAACLDSQYLTVILTAVATPVTQTSTGVTSG